MKKMNVPVAEILIGLCILSLNNIGTSENTEHQTSTLSTIPGSGSITAEENQDMTLTSTYTTFGVPTKREDKPKRRGREGKGGKKSGKEREKEVNREERREVKGTTTEKGHVKGQREKEKLKTRLENTFLYAGVVSCVSCLLIGAGITLCCVYCVKQRNKERREARTAMEMVTKRVEPENPSNNYNLVASHASGGSLGEATRLPGSIPNLCSQSAPTRFEQQYSDYKLATNPNLHCRSRGQGGAHFSGDTLPQDYFVLEVNAPEENRGNGHMSQERPLPSIPHDPEAVLPGLVGFERKDATPTRHFDLASSYPVVEQDMSRRDAHIKTYQPLSQETAYEELE